MTDSPVLTAAVTDGAGAAVIHIDSSTSNKLIITINNQTDNDITIDKLTDPASSSNYNVMFKLPNAQLYFYSAPTVDAASKPGTWSLATGPASGSGWIDAIYVATSEAGTLNPKGQAGDSLTLVIDYENVVPSDPKTLSLLVEVAYQNFTDSSGTPISSTLPTQSMSLMANAGRPSPILGEFVGPRTVLNDGTTQRQLTMRLVNPSLDPVQLLVPSQGEATQSYIEVLLPVSDAPQDAPWALCSSSAWSLIDVALAGSAATGWQAEKSATTAGSIKLIPDYASVTNIPAGGVIELQLNNVVSGLAPGIVQVQVALHRFALIGTQTFGATLEKSPLIYNNGSGSGMKLNAGTLGVDNALILLGDSDDILTHIVQFGAGTALQVDGGDVQFSHNLTTASAAISGTLSANSVNANSAVINGNLTTVDANVNGYLSADSANVYNGITANSANVNGTLTAGGADITGNMTATSANVNGNITANSANINGNITADSATVNGSLNANSGNISGGFSASTASFGYDLSVNNNLIADGGVYLCQAPDYSKGTVGIGGTNYGNVQLQITNTQSTGFALQIHAPGLSSGNSWWALSVTGDCINSTGSWYRFSDINLKQQVVPFTDGLDCLLKLDPISFNFKEEADLGSGKHVGLSAQELGKVAPYMMGKARLKPDGEEEFLAMDPGPLTYMLINAVKELHAEIETLKSKIDTLEHS